MNRLSNKLNVRILTLITHRPLRIKISKSMHNGLTGDLSNMINYKDCRHKLSSVKGLETVLT